MRAYACAFAFAFACVTIFLFMIGCVCVGGEEIEKKGKKEWLAGAMKDERKKREKRFIL